MPSPQTRPSSESVLFVSLDSCRYDSFLRAQTPRLDAVGPVHRAHAPSHFTYGSHAAFWMGFTPGVFAGRDPWLNPKAGKLFRMEYPGSRGNDADGFRLEGPNLIEGFRRRGYATLGSGAVEWFNPASETGAVLGAPFDQFFYPGDVSHLEAQLGWIDEQLSTLPPQQPVFLFLNVGETHVPYWHQGAAWDPWPSPCVPFGDEHASRAECRRRQVACLEWVDGKLGPLLGRFGDATILICADHGDCWGEDGLWEHGISHPATLTVPLLLRVRGIPIGTHRRGGLIRPLTSPSRIRSALASRLRWARGGS